MFLFACIISGCDYVDSISRVGKIKIKKGIKTAFKIV